LAAADSAWAGKSLSEQRQDYDWWLDAQERYLSTSKQLYEQSKLNRNINKSMEDATTSASKARLKALQEQMEAQDRFNKMTQYDVDMLTKQYELCLALEELENARNSKDTVRLVRDDMGNMMYQYTADEDNVSEAEQTYEDKLQEINDLAIARQKELNEMYFSTQEGFRQKAQEIY